MAYGTAMNTPLLRGFFIRTAQSMIECDRKSWQVHLIFSQGDPNKQIHFDTPEADITHKITQRQRLHGLTITNSKTRGDHKGAISRHEAIECSCLSFATVDLCASAS
jgi:hypothetical protein